MSKSLLFVIVLSLFVAFSLCQVKTNSSQQVNEKFPPDMSKYLSSHEEILKSRYIPEPYCNNALSFWLPGTIIWADNGFVYYGTSSDADCELQCDGVTNVMSWTRDGNSGDCYCHIYPFGSQFAAPGVSISAVSGWTSGFYPNAYFSECGNVYLNGQRLYLNNPKFLPSILSIPSCIENCYNLGYGAFTINWFSGYCYCGHLSWSNSSLMQNAGFYASGFSFHRS